MLHIIHTKPNLVKHEIWEVEPTGQVKLSEVMLWGIIAIWLTEFLLYAINFHLQLLIIMVPITLIPVDWKSKLPLTANIINSIFNSRPTSSTLVNILGLLVVLTLQAIFILILVSIYYLIISIGTLL